MSEATAEDRISNLPNSLLHHILSLIHIKYGARASILSRRWNYIWTTVPTLHFQRRHRTKRQWPSSSETDKFMDFVDGTLHRHNSSNVDKFMLFWGAHLNEVRLHSWISTVIRGKVKVLKLRSRQEEPLFIPLSLFTCESLTTLELGGFLHNLTFPRRVSFPRLKRLLLFGLKFTDDCWNEELFSNSPFLEELILNKCEFCLRSFCISIPTLKLLSIHMWVPEAEEGSLDGADFTKEYVSPSFPALVEADFFCFNPEPDVAAIVRLLRALASVKCLSVDNVTLQAIRSANVLSNSFLTFHNVKMLRISINLTTDEGLAALLKAIPMLESLIFRKTMSPTTVVMMRMIILVMRTVVMRMTTVVMMTMIILVMRMTTVVMRMTRGMGKVIVRLLR